MNCPVNPATVLVLANRLRLPWKCLLDSPECSFRRDRSTGLFHPEYQKDYGQVVVSKREINQFILPKDYLSESFLSTR